MKLLRSFEKKFECWFLIGTSILFFILRLPSLFEPYWYGDEGIYQTMGLAMSKGALLYRDIWDNKPPLLYVLYALFAGDQFWLRVLSLVFGLISVLLFYILAKKLFNQQSSLSFIATIFYVLLFGTPLIEGNIANAENFMVIPVLVAAIIVINNKTLQNSKMLFIAGIFSSLAFLIKIVGLFDFAAFATFLFLLNIKSVSSSIRVVGKLIPFGLGFGIPILLTILYFYIAGAFTQFYQGAFTNMVGYVGYGNQFIIPQGLLIIKVCILATILLILLRFRTGIGSSVLFMTVWLLFSTFNAFFAQRPYIHYLLVLLPSFCLFAAFVYGLVIKSRSLSVFQKREEAASIFLIIGVLFLVFNTFNLYDKTPRYYGNFISFMTGNKDISSYYEFFDRNTPRDYQLAQFIKQNVSENEEIFIWGNNAQVYKMVGKLPPGRFTVAYHMTATPETLLETKRALEKQSPRLIIVTSPHNQIPYVITSMYTHRLNIGETAIYERNY